MKTTLTDILDNALRDKRIRVGRDKKYRNVESIMLAGDMLHLHFTDGHTQVAGARTVIEFKEDSGLPPSR